MLTSEERLAKDLREHHIGLTRLLKELPRTHPSYPSVLAARNEIGTAILLLSLELTKGADDYE